MLQVFQMGTWVLLAVQFSLVKGLAGGDPITQHVFFGKEACILPKAKMEQDA